MTTPHDLYCHATFRQLRQVRPWLHWMLPDWLVAAVDWSSLRLVSERIPEPGLRVGVADLVLELGFRGGSSRLLILVEHRSHGRNDLHDTLLRYCVHLRQASQRRGEHCSVVALAIHQAPEPPICRPRLPPAIPEPLRRRLAALQPRQRLLVDDLARSEEPALLARGLPALATLTLLALRSLPGLDTTKTLAALHRWRQVLRQVATEDDGPEGDALTTFGWYLLHATEADAVAIHHALQQLLEHPMTRFTSTAERLRREGLHQGKAEGKAEVLRTLLTRRFGALPTDHAARLQTADEASLDRWTARLLDATSLDAVFDLG